MLDPNITWGDLREFHAKLEDEGATSPDDLLRHKVFQDRNELNPDDDEKVFPEADDTMTYSFTFDDDQDRVLELTKTDSVEGVIYVRSNGDWVALDENDQAPTVFEVPTRDIEPASVGWAINFWDTNADRDEDVTVDEVNVHLI